MKTPKIRFIAYAVKWFDKVNGNTYHSVRITRCKDGKMIATGMHYGYDNHYQQTGLDAMLTAKWIPAKYGKKRPHGGNEVFMYERENNYPIAWNVVDGLKRECVANGKL